MPIDPSIPLQVQPFKTETSVNQLAMMESMAKLGEYQQNIQRANALRNLDRTDPNYINKAYQISPEYAMKAEAHTSTIKKETAQATKAETENIGEHIKLRREALAGVETPEQFKAWSADNYKVPALKNYFEAQGMTSEKSQAKIDATLRQPGGFQQLVGSALIGSGELYKRNNMTASEKGNLNVAQGNLAVNQYNATKPQFSIEAGGWVYPPSTSPTNVPAGSATTSPNAPAGAAPTSALTSKFVPVEGITPKPTEDQAKTNSNINRIVIAAKSMSKVLKDNPKALAPTGTETLAQATPLWEGASAPLTNLTRSADRQIVSSGYADIIDALLYLSTGAAYNKEQLAAQREAFLPAWSDKEANKIEKVAKLQDLVRMAKTRTGKAWTPELEKATQQLLPANLTSEAVPDTTKSGATKSNW